VPGNLAARRAYGHVGGWTPLSGGIELGLLAEGLYEHSDGFKRIDIGGDTGFRITDYVLKAGLRSTDGRHLLEFKYQSFDERSDETYLGLTLADFRADPYRRYNGSQVDQMNVSHETLQLSHRFDFSPAFNLTTVAYRHETGRAWYKLNDVLSGGALRSISSVLANPETFAEGYQTLVGPEGFTSAANALRVRNNNRAYVARGIQTVATARFATGAIDHSLELSARYHEDKEDRLQQDDRYQMVNGRMQLTSAGAPGSQDNRMGEAQAWAFFVRDTITAGALTIVPGLRYETIDLRRTDWALGDVVRGTPTRVIDSNLDVFIPGVAVTWRAAPDVRLVAGAHRGFANPGPGSNVNAETSWNYEAGVRLGNPVWQLEAIAFFNDYSNLLGTCTASTGGNCTIGDQFDGGAVDVKGVEVLAGYRFDDLGGTGISAPVSLVYTYTDARFQTSFASAYGPWGSVSEGDFLPYMPKHQITLNAGLEGRGWRLSATANHVSAARAVAGPGPLPAAPRIA
jgi:Fe(3+) dicitrate transport protein